MIWRDLTGRQSSGKGERFSWIMMLLIAFLIVQGCSSSLQEAQEEGAEEGRSFEALENPPTRQDNGLVMEKRVPEPDRLRLAVVGDLMVHGPQIRAHHQPDGTYDFHHPFRWVRHWLQGADVVVGNLETTFGGAERGYSSFPRFNTPDAFGEALAAAGFTHLSTANNHSIDTDAAGFFRTLDVLEGMGITAIGTRRNREEPFWKLVTGNGITLGITAVTYETPQAYGRRTLNALLIPRELEGLVNSFDYHHLESDLEKVKHQLMAMSEAGADLNVVLIHWGEEYQLQHNAWQVRIANELAAAGADLILGSHPHVIQPVRRIQQEAETSVSYVAYSLGNFISNQRYEILKRHEPEDGVILFVDLVRSPEHGLVEVSDLSYLPTWVHRYWESNQLVYEILPLVEALEKPESFNLDAQESLRRAQKSLERTMKQLSNLPLAR